MEALNSKGPDDIGISRLSIETPSPISMEWGFEGLGNAGDEFWKE